MEHKKNKIFYAGVILAICCLVLTTFSPVVISKRVNSPPKIQKIESQTIEHILGGTSYFKIYFNDREGDEFLIRVESTDCFPGGYYIPFQTNADSPITVSFMWLNVAGKRTITASATEYDTGLSSQKSIRINVVEEI